MARRADLFVRESSDGEAAHVLKRARRGKNAVVRHRAMFLFASFLSLVDEMPAPGEPPARGAAPARDTPTVTG